MNLGKVIVVEGTDFSGKSSLAHDLLDHLCDYGLDAEVIHFPSGVETETFDLYNVLKVNQYNELSEKLLFLGCNLEVIEQIKKAQQKGKTVVCDRSIFSGLAYQNITPTQFGAILMSLGVDGLMIPCDIAIHLSITKEEILRRMRTRGKIEYRDIKFASDMDRVLEYYDTEFYNFFDEAGHVIEVGNSTSEDLAYLVIKEMKKRKIINVD